METHRVCRHCRVKKDIGEFRIRGTKTRCRLCLACEDIWPTRRRCRRCREMKDRLQFPPRGKIWRERTVCVACRYITQENLRQRKIMHGARWRARHKEHVRKLHAAARLRRRSTLEGYVAESIQTTRYRSRRTGVPFELTLDYVLALYHAQNGRCTLTGRTLVFGPSHLQHDALTFDRIVPKLGYIEGNVRLVTWHANVARWSFSDADLLALARAILATAEAKAGAEPSSQSNAAG